MLRRWAAVRHGLDLPHYAVSIVRGRGIDPLALRHLAELHDPARVVFVDGWTGKGAIARELAEAVRAYEGLDPRLAGVLAYLFWIIGGILFLATEKQNSVVRFHAAQWAGREVG